MKRFIADDTVSDALAEAIRALGYDVDESDAPPEEILAGAERDGKYVLTTTFDYLEDLDRTGAAPPGIICFRDEPDHPMNPIEVFGAFVSENPEGLDGKYTLVTPETLKQRAL